MPYRYGGDEFVIVAANRSAESLDRIKKTLLKRFSKEWRIDDKSVYCGISAGAVPLGNKTVEELIHAADMVMYEVKRSGKHGFRLGSLDLKDA
jgi:diguanylate cyclase (GGDEF)-like protein